MSLPIQLLFAFLLPLLTDQSPTNKIIGGSPARDGQYPFIVSLFITKPAGRYFCGGALINETWVLTAGHCVDSGTLFTIQLGSSTIQSNDPNRIVFVSNVSYQHPEYDSLTLANDIGLVKLPESVSFGHYIDIIDLAYAPIEDDSLVIAVGWGQTADGATGIVDRLQQVQMVIMQNDLCKTTYGEQIHDNMVCAVGNFNEGLCIGDTGTPLILKQGIYYTHIGIASFLSNRGCESPDPSGFSRTYPYIEWIYGIIDSEIGSYYN